MGTKMPQKSMSICGLWSNSRIIGASHRARGQIRPCQTEHIPDWGQQNLNTSFRCHFRTVLTCHVIPRGSPHWFVCLYFVIANCRKNSPLVHVLVLLFFSFILFRSATWPLRRSLCQCMLQEYSFSSLFVRMLTSYTEASGYHLITSYWLSFNILASG